MVHISSRNNQKIIDTTKLQKRKHRDASSLFCFEGYKVFLEALSAGIEFVDIFVRDDVLTKYPELLTVDQITTVSESVYSKLSNDTSPDGIFCVAKKPEQKDSTGGSKLIAVSVRDPGNIGTMIRSALAFGVDELILSDDCADIYSQKVVRSAMGALFRQRITVSDDILREINEIKSEGYFVYATALSENSIPISDIDVNDKCCFVIGNEGHGLDREIIDACHKQVIIPIAAESESLNAAVAASVLMWEMKRNY